MKKIAPSVLLLFITLSGNAQNYSINSPDGKLSSEIKIADQISVSLMRGKETILSLNNLFIATDLHKQASGNLEVRKAERKSVNEMIKPVIREKSETIINNYNEIDIRFRSGLSVTFRLFNEGLAYRFSTLAKDSLTVFAENLDINLTETDSIRYQASGSFNSSYETPYEFKRADELEKDALSHLPLLVEKGNGLFIMITESDLYDYPGLWLKGTGSAQLIATNPPYPKLLTYEGNIYNHGQITQTHDYIAKVSGSRTYPWRIFAVAAAEDGLITNNMVYLLASPGKSEDFSWVKPGVVMFDWWAKFNIYGVDFKAGINTETAKYFIDFCAEHGFRYFLFDDGWSPGGDILREIPGLDMAEVTSYAREKGVEVMLWVLWHSLEKQWDQAFDQFEKWGIKGIKIDFMNRDDQPMVKFFEDVAAKAAEKKMVVNFHGAYKPCGLRRKYPNVLTREALIEFEYSGVSHNDNTEHHNLLPFIRMFTGPMDYIPATMRNSTKDNFRPLSDYPMGQGTRAHSMALFVILNSPMTMLPDSPSDYYREKECTGFIAKIPVEWDETRLLNGKIAQYTILARRSGEDWFIGAITNQDGRSIELDTDFLGEGSFHIEAVEDGINANSRAEDYKLINRVFKSGESIKFIMAKGGGWIARITPVKK